MKDLQSQGLDPEEDCSAGLNDEKLRIRPALF